MLSEVAKLKRLARYNLLVCSLKNEVIDRLRFFSKKISTVVKWIEGPLARSRPRGHSRE